MPLEIVFLQIHFDNYFLYNFDSINLIVLKNESEWQMWTSASHLRQLLFKLIRRVTILNWSFLCVCSESDFLQHVWCVCRSIGENKRKLTLRKKRRKNERTNKWMNEKRLVSIASVMKCSFFPFTYSIGPASYGCWCRCYQSYCLWSFSFHCSTLIYLFIYFSRIFCFVFANIRMGQKRKCGSKIIRVLHTIPFAVVPIFSHSQIDDDVQTYRRTRSEQHDSWYRIQFCKKDELELLLPPPSSFALMSISWGNFAIVCHHLGNESLTHTQTHSCRELLRLCFHFVAILLLWSLFAYNSTLNFCMCIKMSTHIHMFACE